MYTKRLLYLIARIQMKIHGEQIQDKSLLCLTTQKQMKIHVKQFKNATAFLPRNPGCDRWILLEMVYSQFLPRSAGCEVLSSQ